MGQPQHVRNELHVQFWIINEAAAFYEIYTRQFVNPTLESSLQTWPAFSIPEFNSVKHYWTGGPGAYIGMADVTAKNFITYKSSFSATVANDDDGDGVGGTLYVTPSPEFPLPNGTTPTTYALRPELVTLYSLSNGTNVKGYVNYLVGTVRDDFGGNRGNVRLAAETQISRIRSANFAEPRRFGVEDRQVIEDAQSFLLPRAVAFSAGIINHFFRARVSLSHSSGTTWTLSNPTKYPMSGTYWIYAEDAAGNRAYTGIGKSATLGAGASTPISIELGAAPAKLIAVFQGSVGTETNMVAGAVVPYVAPPPAAIPCGGTLSANGGAKGYSATMDLGTASGLVQVRFDTYSIPDALTITSTNAAKSVIATSGGLVYGSRAYSYNFDASALGSRYVNIKVTGNTDTNTKWNLAVSCPGGTLDAPAKPTNVTFKVIGASMTCGVSNTYMIDDQTVVKVSNSVQAIIPLSPGPHTFAFVGQTVSAGCTQWGHPGYVDGAGTTDVWNGAGTTATIWICSSPTNCSRTGTPY
jgi:hypothetical protein